MAPKQRFMLDRPHPERGGHDGLSQAYGVSQLWFHVR